MPPIIRRAITLPSKSPATAKVAPKARAPTSPSHNRAGETLKYKKAIKLPSHKARKKDKGVSRIAADKTQKANKATIKTNPAKPSSPSVMLTALAKATITVAAKGTYSQPRCKVLTKGMYNRSIFKLK